MGCAQATQSRIQRVPAAVDSATTFLNSEISALESAKDSVIERSSFHSDFQVVDKIGSGAYAQVYHVLHCASGISKAAKVSDMTKSTMSASDKHMREIAMLEFSIMRLVSKSSYCVGASCAYEDESLSYIVMEKVDASLARVLQEADVTEKLLRWIFRDALRGLQFIHGLGILHRDVKPDNFLCNVTSCGAPSTVRLCDFGLSAMLGSGTHVKGGCGTAPYMSPEMLKGRLYGVKTDIWSLGVMVFVLLTGVFPYMPAVPKSSAMKKAIREGGTPVFKAVVPDLQPSQEAQAFGSALLCRDPTGRPTARQALRSDFLAPNPPLGQKWRAISLRPLVEHAKEIGAFALRQKKTSWERIDDILAEKQAEAHRSLRQHTFEATAEAPEDPYPSFGMMWGSTPSASFSGPTTVDSLPSMASPRGDYLTPTSGIFRMSNTADALPCMSSTVGALPSMAEQDFSPLPFMAVWDGALLPSMAARGHPPPFTAGGPSSGQRIAHNVRPVMPAVPLDTSEAADPGAVPPMAFAQPVLPTPTFGNKPGPSFAKPIMPAKPFSPGEAVGVGAVATGRPRPVHPRPMQPVTCAQRVAPVAPRIGMMPATCVKPSTMRRTSVEGVATLMTVDVLPAMGPARSALNIPTRQTRVTDRTPSLCNLLPPSLEDPGAGVEDDASAPGTVSMDTLPSLYTSATGANHCMVISSRSHSSTLNDNRAAESLGLTSMATSSRYTSLLDPGFAGSLGTDSSPVVTPGFDCASPLVHGRLDQAAVSEASGNGKAPSLQPSSRAGRPAKDPATKRSPKLRQLAHSFRRKVRTSEASDAPAEMEFHSVFGQAKTMFE